MIFFKKPNPISFERKKNNVRSFDNSVLKQFYIYINNFLLDEIEKFNEQWALAIRKIHLDIEQMIEANKDENYDGE